MINYNPEIASIHFHTEKFLCLVNSFDIFRFCLLQMGRFLLLALLVSVRLVVTAQVVEDITDDLRAEMLTPGVWQHISVQHSNTFGSFTSNGLIFIHEDEAVVFDSPPTVAQGEALLTWMHERFPLVKVKAIVVNHFHDDCIGGLEAFHNRAIPSVSSRLTKKMIRKRGEGVIPRKAFGRKYVISVGGSRVENYYFGRAHSPDNIVSWIPSAKVLFGGCMVKAKGAGKGNLSDADVSRWAETVIKVRAAFTGVNIVVPGHGQTGGIELLDYTISLFSL
jgi:metallo-beta-lactamase class B